MRYDQLFSFFCLLAFPLFIIAQQNAIYPENIALVPSNGAINVNPDVKLTLSFPVAPILHNAGKIRIYDTESDELIDELDMSIPPGPKNTRTPAPYDSFEYTNFPNTLFRVSNPDTNSGHVYQKNYIGGDSEADAYHFFPILIHGKTATIHLHNQVLNYAKTYRVEVDKEIFSLNGDHVLEFKGKQAWTFSTKKVPPSKNERQYIVSSHGEGHFNTVQGALDFIEEVNPDRKEILVKNGRYEEIVYFRNRENITIIGEHRDSTLICYANNGVFNNRPFRNDPAISYHNRRAVVAVNSSKGIHIANMTIRSLGEQPAQAEALLVKGDEIIVSNVNVEGSGDALQATGTIYISNSKIQGFGDNVLGYGAVFFDNCEFVSTYGPHMWVRNPKENHGNVCVNCKFRTIGDVETTIARTNDNRGDGFPYCEAVLIDCMMEGVKPEGWSIKGKGISDIHYWEYNSRDLETGKPINMTERNPIARQLTQEDDADLIKYYKNPSNILKDWSPAMKPFVTTQPISQTFSPGEMIRFNINYASIQPVRIQWYKDGKLIKGAIQKELVLSDLKRKDTGKYTVTIENSSGTTSSREVNLTLIN